MRHWMPSWAVVCLIVMSVGTVWLRLSIVRTSYDINQADHQIRELQLAREYSTVKYTGLRSPRRLELLARTRFGLAQPRPEQIVRLDQETRPTNSIRQVSQKITLPSKPVTSAKAPTRSRTDRKTAAISSRHAKKPAKKGAPHAR